MALDPRQLAKVIEIINNREKAGPGGPGKPATVGPGKGAVPVQAYQGGKELTPTGRTNEFNYAGGLNEYLKLAQARGLDVSNVQSEADLQGRIYDNLMQSEEGQGVLRNMWQSYGDTRAGSGSVLPKNLSAQDLAGLRSSFADNMLGGRTQMVLDRIPPRKIPPIDTPPPTVYEDPSSKYRIQGRLPSGEQVLYFPKDIDQWRSVTGGAGVDGTPNTLGVGEHLSRSVQGANGEVGADANYYMNPVQIRAMLGNDPQKLAALGEGYIQDLNAPAGKARWKKQADAEKEWNDEFRSHLIKSGFKGEELERTFNRDRARNPYRAQ